MVIVAAAIRFPENVALDTAAIIISRYVAATRCAAKAIFKTLKQNTTASMFSGASC